MNEEMLKKYLFRAAMKDEDIQKHGDWTNPNVDHLSGWEMPHKPAPDHLHGGRYWCFLAGQKARKLRNADHFTCITAWDDELKLFSKSFRGRLSHKRIVRECEKHNALNEIIAVITDMATGKRVVRNIGY